MNVWVNGRLAATISAWDRGLHYGDGLFETMSVRGGAVRLLDWHLERLQSGLRRLHIAGPASALLRRELRAAAADSEHAVLKLLITRGVGRRGYRPSGDERSTRILQRLPAPPAQPPGPVRVRVCRTRLGSNPALAGLKTLNRLESVLARNEWRDGRLWEGLMLDMEDHLVCGTMSNLFLRHRGTLVTPRLDRCGVAGVMRRWILEQCRGLNIPVREQRIGWRELVRAEEVFMSNALVGVKSVRRVEWPARQRLVDYDDFALADQLRGRLEAL